MSFPWGSVLAYCVFCQFLFYQKLHVKNFRGGSEALKSMLIASITIGTMVGIYFLYKCWGAHQWWVPVAAFLGSMASSVILFGAMERFASPFFWSLVAFAGWPASAIVMFLLV